MHEVIREMFKKEFAHEKQEGIQEGIQKGIKEGINEANEQTAIDMLKDREPLEKIKKYSRLAEDVIRGLAVSLGVSVM